MSKKTKIIIAISALILLVVGVGIFFFLKKSTPSSNTQTNNSPFGTDNGGTSQNDFPSVIVGDAPTAIKEYNGLKKISSAPVSDGNFLPFSTSSTQTVEFIERSTGHTFEANLNTGSIVRTSNTTIPKIQNVVWGIPGKSFLAQLIDSGTIQSKILEVAPKASSTNSFDDFKTINEYILDPNIISASFSPKADRVFYLINGYAGTQGYLANGKGQNPSLVWESATTEWLTEWVSGDTVAITSKASSESNGILLFLDTKTKKTKTILSGVRGLTTKTSPSGNKVLYSSISTSVSGDRSPYSTSIYNVKTQSNDEGSFVTLPEKCVWSQSEIYIVCGQPREIKGDIPDAWYRGEVSFQDELWLLNLQTLEMRRISELNPNPGEFIDVINPHISPDGTYVTFTNKKDLSLWATPLDQ